MRDRSSLLSCLVVPCKIVDSEEKTYASDILVLDSYLSPSCLSFVSKKPASLFKFRAALHLLSNADTSASRP